MKRNPTDVNIVEKPFSDQSYLSDHMGMQIMQRDSNLAKYRLYTENSAFARHNEIDTDKILDNVYIVIKLSLVIVAYVYIWEYIQERNNISALIVKTSDISGTLNPLLDSSESAP